MLGSTPPGDVRGRRKHLALAVAATALQGEGSFSKDACRGHSGLLVKESRRHEKHTAGSWRESRTATAPHRAKAGREATASRHRK